MDELTVIPVTRIVKDVRACVDANISVAGLALALTIPDVLGQRCYPNMVYDNGDRKVHAQYSRWFDTYVAERFGGSDSWFSGDMCYELRCALLHSGQADIEYRHHERAGMKYEYQFALVDDGEQFHEERAHASKANTRICKVHINADELASALCDGAEHCLAGNR